MSFTSIVKNELSKLELDKIEAIYVFAGTITSSPFPIPNVFKASSIACVPFVRPKQYFTPCIFANFSSNSFTLVPVIRHQLPLSKTSFKLYGRIFVLIPTAIPSAPIKRTTGSFER